MAVETLVHAWIDSSKIIIVVLVKIPVNEKKVKHSCKILISKAFLQPKNVCGHFQGLVSVSSCHK